jgi:hypothetical protein
VESLRDLPDRTTRLEIRIGAVVSQIVHLRAEMRDEFSAIRREMVTKEDLGSERVLLRAEMATKEDLRNGLNGLRRELQEDIARLGRDFAARLLESEGRTRVLIEDLVVRITTGREGRPSAN